MEVDERIENLERDIDYPRLIQRALRGLERVLERDAVDILHHEIVMVLLAEAIEDARDVFVVELCEHVGLALEGGHRLMLHVGTGEAVDHLGQRASPRGEPQVLGEVDELHPAAAERPHDLVPAADYGVLVEHRCAIAVATATMPASDPRPTVAAGDPRAALQSTPH